MATKAAVAAMDRRSKENIADKDRALNEKIARKNFELQRHRAGFQNVRDAAAATESLSKAAFGKQGIAGGISGSFNHPEWYKKFGSDKYTAEMPTFTRAGREPFANFLCNNAGTGNNIQSANTNIPGICVINYYSVLPNQNPGSNGYKYSPINVGLSRFMAELRKMNSRIGDYDASDYGLYWYAGVDFASLICQGVQGIKAYNTYHIDNAYFADALITALGFNVTDFKANIAKYKYCVDKYIRVFNSNIMLPKNLTFVQRRLWLANTIVKDHAGSNASIYMFKQRVYGILSEDEISVNYGAGAFTNVTFTTFEGLLESMATRLADSKGMQTLMADLKAGIPDNNFIKLEPINGDEEITIMDGKYELEQIHNLLTLPVQVGGSGLGESLSSSATYLNIHSMADGYLAQGSVDSTYTTLTTPGPILTFSSTGDFKPVIDALNTSTQNRHILNFYNDKPIDDDILEATRLRSHFYAYSPGSNTSVYSLVRGTELVTHCTIYVYNKSLALLNITWGTTYFYSSADAAEVCLVQSLASKFDWLPVCRYVMYGVDANENPSSIIYFHTSGELDTVVPIGYENLQLLHEQCSLSMFYIDSSEFNRTR